MRRRIVHGDAVRRLRRDRGWTRDELALRVGLSVDMIKAIELGYRQPGEDKGHLLSAAFGCQVDDFSDAIAA